MSNKKPITTPHRGQVKGKISPGVKRKPSVTTKPHPKTETPATGQSSAARIEVVKPQPTQGMSFEDQVKLQMEHLKQQQKMAKEMRENDKEMQKQSLEEKLKLRSEMKKTKKAKSPPTGKGAKKPVDQPPKVQDIHLESQKKTHVPYIPIMKKEAICTEDTMELFNDLEDFASNVGTVVSPSLTFAILMETLYIAELSDLEKVRLLFHWITAQNLNGINFTLTAEDDTPLQYFKAIKQNEKTYAALFVRLCGAAGLHAKMITGFLKGAGYYPDYKFGNENDPFRGSWNAVLLQGEWRLIDTNWGARHVTEEGETRININQPSYVYEEHYFLTDPELLINTHYPDQMEWQLLSPPLTLEQFEKTPKLWPLFFKLKLELLSHKQGVITADDTGYVKVQIKVSPFARTDARLKGELRMRGKIGTPEVADIPQNLFHHTSSDLETFEVFIPTPGKYLLKLFAHSNKYNEVNIYTNICLYQIDCAATGKPAMNCKVFPPFPNISSFYGPSVFNSECIARPVSHTGPIVECDEDGEAKVIIKVTAEDPKIAFAHDLFDSTSSKNAINHRVICSYDKSPTVFQITYFIRAPSKGNFALCLYSNIADTSVGSFVPFCYYLVNSTKAVKSDDFMKIPNDVIGPIHPNFQEANLRFRFCHPEALCEWKIGKLTSDTDGDCILGFEHPQPITVMADLSCPHATESLNDYVNVQSTGLLTCIVIRTPSNKYENALFLLKIYASEGAPKGNIPCVYVTMITPGKEKLDVEAFPQSPSKCWGPSPLHYAEVGITWMSFENSVWAFKGKYAQSQFVSSGPCRVYNGGTDFEVFIKSLGPIQLKTKLQNHDDPASDALDGFMLLVKGGSQSSVIQVRFPQTGNFTLIVYGSKLENASNQLVPLSYLLIKVTKATNCTNPYPLAFGVWASSARNLISPMNLVLRRNKEYVVKVYLAKYKKSDDELSWTEVTYPSVMFVVDGNHPVHPVSTANNLYEWKYLPGPGEKLAGVLVKPDASAQAMTYALQYQIQDNVK